MEVTELSGSQAFEMAFIECQGLAAWMAADWSHPSAAENASTPHLLGDLVSVLADLVLGEWKESANGSASSTVSTSFGTLANAGPMKVKPAHLKRDAFLYIRQSTLRQVQQNTESTQRQYALQQRAVALGWTVEKIHIIDCDLGQSGASTVDREGFQQLVAEVSLGHVGVVLGLDVSRLARNSADWQRLLELCAITDTLILDEDGLYDCNDFNDRLLLGLKGTLSEAELHFLRARMAAAFSTKLVEVNWPVLCQLD